jgi:hypothetical protein
MQMNTTKSMNQIGNSFYHGGAAGTIMEGSSAVDVSVQMTNVAAAPAKKLSSRAPR